MSAPVRLRLAPDPANVRVARLVAVGTARAAGLDEDRVDDVRLAVGEVCSRAVLLHLDGGLEEHVEVELVRDDGLRVRVRDADADAGEDVAPPADLSGTGEQVLLDVEGAFVVDLVALLRGLADDVAVSRTSTGTTVELAWAAPPATT